jgi:hypothetical protein
MGALSLYLDFIHMFMMLLRLFGDRRGRPARLETVARTGDRLFDHFVGGREERFRYLQVERLGGLEIDGECILVRRLHR